jgi:heat shock protein HslJ
MFDVSRQVEARDSSASRPGPHQRSQNNDNGSEILPPDLRCAVSDINPNIESRHAVIRATALFSAFADPSRLRCHLLHCGIFLLLAALAIPINASAGEEQPLICFGNEPSWRLDLAVQGKASFSTPDSAAVDYIGSATAFPPRKESIWRGRATVPGGGELVAFLREGACSDNMSETVHPYSVNVSMPDGRHYAGCCRLSESVADSVALEKATWRLTGLPGQGLPADQGRNAITVTFESGRVHGFSGCNQFTGSYSLDGQRLVLGPLGGTMMACPEPAMSVERTFQGAFSGMLDIAVAGNELTLTPADGGEALRFEREAPPRLEGVQWEVSGYNNGRQAVVGPLVGTRLTLMFEDGQISGFSGCNRFRGLFEVEGNALTIQPLATTRKACEHAVMVQEQEFLRALESATTWDIVRGMLDVHRADGERVLTASEVHD